LPIKKQHRGRISILVAATACSGWFTSCTLHTSYRHYPSKIDLPCNVRLAVVELDDHGEFWDRPQLDRALGAIGTAQGIEDDGGTGAIVVTFVHGWNNNASHGNEWDTGGSLHKFKDTLVTIAQREREFAGPAAVQKPVVGIYVAWRGESIHPKPIALVQDIFTFYSRYSAAKKVAAGPAITETLLALAATARRNSRTQSIIVGHSFGGLIVEKALSQVIVQIATQEALKKGATGGYTYAPVGLAKFPADLIVLVNPASPALFARSEVSAIEQWRLQLADKMDSRFVCEGNESRRPILVSITSVGDSATGTWFPVGTTVGYSLERFREYKYESYNGFQPRACEKLRLSWSRAHRRTWASWAPRPAEKTGRGVLAARACRD